jgi:hypothetical protein
VYRHRDLGREKFPKRENIFNVNKQRFFTVNVYHIAGVGRKSGIFGKNVLTFFENAFKIILKFFIHFKKMLKAKNHIS